MYFIWQRLTFLRPFYFNMLLLEITEGATFTAQGSPPNETMCKESSKNTPKQLLFPNNLEFSLRD